MNKNKFSGIREKQASYTRKMMRFRRKKPGSGFEKRQWDKARMEKATGEVQQYGVPVFSEWRMFLMEGSLEKEMF